MGHACVAGAHRGGACSRPRRPATTIAVRQPIWSTQNQQEVSSLAYQYKVIEIREKMIGGKMSGDKLEKILNDHAKDGWQLKAITATDVKGRVGPGGVEGLLITLEKAV
jgi:hypothetical protein